MNFGFRFFDERNLFIKKNSDNENTYAGNRE